MTGGWGSVRGTPEAHQANHVYSRGLHENFLAENDIGRSGVTITGVVTRQNGLFSAADGL